MRRYFPTVAFAAWTISVGAVIYAVATVWSVDTDSIAPRTAVITEDSPGWDALRMGNRAGIVGGVLVVAVDDMPADPYDRCMYLLSISGRLGGLPYDTAMLCEPIKENR